MREDILQILEENKFGQLDGVGRKLRLQDLTA